MAHQTALLGEDDEIVVLVANVEGNGLWNDGSRFADLGKLDGDAVTLGNLLLFGEARFAVDGHGTRLNELRAGRA